MFVIGLILLVLAAIVAVIGVVTNLGSAAAMTGGFTIFGFPVGGYTGWLFLFGVVVGAIGLLGLGIMVRSLGRHRARRREFRDTRREAREHRQREEKLAGELEKERAERARLEAASGTAGADTGHRTGEAAETRADTTGADTDRPAPAGPPRQRTEDEHAAGLRERLGFGHRTKK
jgi:uncharacterized membrane protein